MIDLRKGLLSVLKSAKLLRTDENVYVEDLKKFIKNKNIFCFLRVAKLYSLKLLNSFLVTVVENNFVRFSKTLGFKNIDHKTFKAFISASTITVSSETEVFQAVVNWIEYDEKSRKHYMCDLLKFVRLPLLTDEIIEKLVKNNKFCQSCRKCCTHIETVLAVKQKPKNSVSDFLQNRFCIDNFTLFNFHSHIACLRSDISFKNIDKKFQDFEMKNFQFCNTANRNCFKLYSSGKRDCDEIAPNIEQNVQNFTACVFMDKLYVTGGFDCNRDESTCCAVYDPETTGFTMLEDLQEKRCHHSCVVFAGKMVATGGWYAQRSVEAYDHFENKWSFMPDMLEIRYYHGSVAMGNKLYVTGGINIRYSEVFDYVSNKFTLLKPLPLDDYGLSAFNALKIVFFRIKDKVVVKYDFEDKSRDNIFIYDKDEDKWNTMCVGYFKENGGQLMYS